MIITLTLRCHKSLSYSKFRIWFDKTLLYDHQSDRELLHMNFDIPTPKSGDHVLTLEHYDKHDQDTLCDSKGNIVADRAVEIESLTIDGFAIPREIIFAKKFYPKWPQHFDLDSMPEFITQNNFLGFNGEYHFDFQLPMAPQYYSYFWDMEIIANTNFTKADEQQEEYFEAYGMKIKIEQDLNFNLTDLKRLIEFHEK